MSVYVTVAPTPALAGTVASVANPLVKFASNARWTVNPASWEELSTQFNVILGLLAFPFQAPVRPVGASGGTANTSECMKSISSWDRMWQWYTYSQPKLTSWLTTLAVGLPCGSVLKNPAVEPVGIIGLRLRMEFGSSNGTWGTMGRRATMVSSSGLMRTVSFQPISFGSGGITGPAIVIVSILNALISLIILVSGFKNYVKLQNVMIVGIVLAFFTTLIVMFTANPLTGRRRETVIDAAFGLA